MREFVLYGARNPFGRVLDHIGCDAAHIMSVYDVVDEDGDVVERPRSGVVSRFSPVTGEQMMDGELWTDNPDLAETAESGDLVLRVFPLPELTSVGGDGVGVFRVGDQEFCDYGLSRYDRAEPVTVRGQEDGWYVVDGEAPPVQTDDGEDQAPGEFLCDGVTLTAVPLSGELPDLVNPGVVVSVRNEGVELSGGVDPDMASGLQVLNRPVMVNIVVDMLKDWDGVFRTGGRAVSYRCDLLSGDGEYPPAGVVVDEGQFMALSGVPGVQFRVDDGEWIENPDNRDDPKGMWRGFLEEVLYPYQPFLYPENEDMASLLPGHVDMVGSLDMVKVVDKCPVRSVPRFHLDKNVPSLFTSRVKKSEKVARLVRMQDIVAEWDGTTAGDIRLFCSMMSFFKPEFAHDFDGLYSTGEALSADPRVRLETLVDFINAVPDLVVGGGEHWSDLFCVHLLNMMTSREKFLGNDILASSVIAGGEASMLVSNGMAREFIRGTEEELSGQEWLQVPDDAKKGYDFMFFNKAHSVAGVRSAFGDDPEEFLSGHTCVQQMSAIGAEADQFEKVSIVLAKVSAFLDSDAVFRLSNDVCVGQIDLMLTLLDRCAAVSGLSEGAGEAVTVMQAGLEGCREGVLSGSYPTPMVYDVARAWGNKIRKDGLPSEYVRPVLGMLGSFLVGYSTIGLPVGLSALGSRTSKWGVMDQDVHNPTAEFIREFPENTTWDLLVPEMFTGWGWGVTGSSREFMFTRFAASSDPGVQSLEDVFTEALGHKLRY